MAIDDLKTLGSITLLPDGLHAEYVFDDAKKVLIGLISDRADAEATFACQKKEPTVLAQLGVDCWVYRGVIFKVDPQAEATLGRDRLVLLIKHRVMRDERRWAKIQREVEALENVERLPSARRERIPDGVRLFVWQRDEGKCVQCGSQVSLEFDHVIPVIKGGANTERNVRLLCEPCNRRKGASI